MDEIGAAENRWVLPVSTVLSLVLYRLPAVIARARGDPRADSIPVVNTTLGWTVVGWLLALVWSARSSTSPDRPAPS